MAALGLSPCERAFSSCGKWGPLFIAVCGPLTIAASLVAEHRLQTRRLSNCGPRAQPLRGMRDPPGPGLEPVSPALAGRLSTTAPPGKPLLFYFWFFGPKVCGILAHWPGIEPTPPALEGEVLTTGPPGKSPLGLFEASCGFCSLRRLQWSELGSKQGTYTHAHAPYTIHFHNFLTLFTLFPQLVLSHPFHWPSLEALLTWHLF